MKKYVLPCFLNYRNYILWAFSSITFLLFFAYSENFFLFMFSKFVMSVFWICTKLLYDHWNEEKKLEEVNCLIAKMQEMLGEE